MVNRSVYAGVGGQNIVEEIREKVRGIIGERDSVFIILVQEHEYLRATVCTHMDCKKVEEVSYDII